MRIGRLIPVYLVLILIIPSGLSFTEPVEAELKRARILIMTIRVVSALLLAAVFVEFVYAGSVISVASIHSACVVIKAI